RLWARTRDLYDCTAVRSAQVLNWFCFEGAPEFAKTVFGYYEGEELLGYLICFTSDWRGYTCLETLDLWTVGGGRRLPVARALVRAALQARGHEQFFVLPHFSPELVDVFGPVQRLIGKPTTRRHYFKAGNESVPLPVAGRCFLSALEGDLAL